MTFRAAISDYLPISVVLGTDVPELGQLLHCNPASIHTKGTVHALITTMSATRREESKAQFEIGAGALALEEESEWDVGLQKLKEAGLTAKPGKCRFTIRRCSYLGHVVSGGEVRVKQSKVEAVEGIELPRRKKVRMFLSLTGYCRQLVADYSNIATPLSDMTQKTQPNQVRWTPEGVAAFEKLKRGLYEASVLKTPDFTKEFVLQTDAYDRGVGAVLSQQAENGGSVVVAQRGAGGGSCPPNNYKGEYSPSKYIKHLDVHTPACMERVCNKITRLISYPDKLIYFIPKYDISYPNKYFLYCTQITEHK